MADDLATQNDVESRWQPLTGQSQVVCDSLLTDASAMVRAAVPDVDYRIAGDALVVPVVAPDPEYAELVRGVVAAMVIRVMRDQFQPGTGASALYVGAGELNVLVSSGTGTSAFSIIPGGVYAPGYAGGVVDEFGWNL